MNKPRGIWRGKRIDNGEWVKGDLLRDDISDVAAIVTYVNLSGDVRDLSEINIFQVIPETLGECIGLTDKNGKLLFEGDVVKTKKYGKIVGHSNVNDYDIFVVKYEPAMFMLKNHNRGFNLVDDGYSKLEVIGNIHDNPKLARWKDGDNND